MVEITCAYNNSNQHNTFETDNTTFQCRGIQSPWRNSRSFLKRRRRFPPSCPWALAFDPEEVTPKLMDSLDILVCFLFWKWNILYRVVKGTRISWLYNKPVVVLLCFASGHPRLHRVRRLQCQIQLRWQDDRRGNLRIYQQADLSPWTFRGRFVDYKK